MDLEQSKPPSRRGGARPGAGRPKGARNALPLGSVRALVSGACARKRLEGQPEDTDAKAALEHAFGRVADVLEGTVDFKKAHAVLKAAGMVADAVAGVQAKKLEVKAEVTLEQVVKASYELDAPKPAGGEGGHE